MRENFFCYSGDHAFVILIILLGRGILKHGLSEHGVGFAATRLAIGKHRRVVAVERILDQVGADEVVNLILRRLWLEDLIKLKNMERIQA